MHVRMYACQDLRLHSQYCGVFAVNVRRTVISPQVASCVLSYTRPFNCRLPVVVGFWEAVHSYCQ